MSHACNAFGKESFVTYIAAVLERRERGRAVVDSSCWMSTNEHTCQCISDYTYLLDCHMLKQLHDDIIASTSSTSSSSFLNNSRQRRASVTTTMAASPIWEDHQHQHQQSQPDYDDDVPLSFFSPSFLMADDVEAPHTKMTGNVRRSHTVTATGSRLHRITGSGGSNILPPDNTKQLSASTGVSRRTSMKATPGLNRVVENSNSGGEGEGEGEEGQQQYPCNAYDNENDLDLDNQALYSIGSTTSLARHSSMPVSRAFRRDRQLAGSSNPGAPWQRVNSIKGHSSSSTTSEEQTAHLRRNSTAAEVHNFFYCLSRSEQKEANF
jgi:hypothetical protein